MIRAMQSVPEDGRQSSVNGALSSRTARRLKPSRWHRPEVPAPESFLLHSFILYVTWQGLAEELRQALNEQEVPTMIQEIIEVKKSTAQALYDCA